MSQPDYEKLYQLGVNPGSELDSHPLQDPRQADDDPDDAAGAGEGADRSTATQERQQRSASREKNYVAYTIKLPSDQLSALQSIWLELKKLYGTHSPDKSGMIQAAIDHWLKGWDGPDREKLLDELLDIRQSTRRRQYRKGK